ncbi:chloride channel protein [Corynebacterium pelargi]|nr:chloride channel protein [Corynebacterium pelargi]
MTKRRVWTGKMVLVAIIFGGVAGVLSGLTYGLMQWLQHLIWSEQPSWIYTFSVVLIAGVLIACINIKAGEFELQQEIEASEDLQSFHRGKAMLIAAGAIVAVAAGGAIGPEAGLVGVVGQLSALVNMRITQTREQAVALAKIGNAAALGSLYGSPPAGATYEDDTFDNHKVVPVLAAIAGMGGFLLVINATPSHHAKLDFMATGDFSMHLMVPTLFAAIIGAAFGLGFSALHHGYQVLNERIGHPVVRTIGWSILLALLLASLPQLRFSGQDALADLVAHPGQTTGLALLGLAVGKLIATIITLAAGWKGGEFFPLMLIGACAGMWVAGSESGVLAADLLAATAIAGIGAALTVTLRKPLTIVLILLLLAHHVMVAPLLIGVGVGYVVQLFLPNKQDADVSALTER